MFVHSKYSCIFVLEIITTSKTSIMKNLNNPAIQQFIIETALIDPISDIINKLNNGEFRDCDIKWLDNKLENFVSFAADTLGINFTKPSHLFGETFKYINEYSKTRYLERFNLLSKYFETFIQ